ncbi:hypothetical protein [Nocardia sp. NPDC050710]|uniref:hypothetical protein n=1 Tax=Nocardia sp. NPDC050710 TaxID=3157220 RepID=UPI0033C4B42C
MSESGPREFGAVGDEGYSTVTAIRPEVRAAVLDSIRNLLAVRDDSSFDSADLVAPRGNVLVFHGVGGGVDTVAREIAELLASRESAAASPDSALPRAVPVRIDAERADIASILLAIRRAVGYPGRRMPCFDLVFRRYIDYAGIDEPPAEYLGDALSTGIDDAVRALGLPRPPGALAGPTLAAVVRALRRNPSPAFGCRRLPDLLELEPDAEALSYYPHLLAWDLAQLPTEDRVLPVILLDGFDDPADRTRERIVQRVAWLLPNALFVIVGRHRLRWDDIRRSGELDFAGPTRWPLLGADADREPRQHLFGRLSPSDSEDYLARTFTRGGLPLVPAPIRAMIAARSEGLPLHLEFAAMRFRELSLLRGTVPAAAEFDLDFLASVTRAFLELAPDERQVLRAASLVDSFSLDLVATIARGADEDAARRLIDRPFIESDPAGVRPYRVPEAVRSAMQKIDARSADAWCPEQWRRAAQRAIDALGRQWRDAADSDARTASDCVAQGVRLVRDFALPLGWLTAAGVGSARP